MMCMQCMVSLQLLPICHTGGFVNWCKQPLQGNCHTHLPLQMCVLLHAALGLIYTSHVRELLDAEGAPHHTMAAHQGEAYKLRLLFS